MATSNNNNNNNSGSSSGPVCPPSRPTTPLRRSSRESLHASLTHPSTLTHPFPLDTLESTFAELADSLTDLHTNLMHLQLMHESMSRFNESFSAFLYGLNVNAFCVDFPEAPITESFKLAERHEAAQAATAAAAGGPQGAKGPRWRSDYEAEMTFMTNETSFVNEPKPTTPISQKPGSAGGSGVGRGAARGIPRAGGVPRGAGRAARGAAGTGTGITRGGGGRGRSRG